MWGRGEREGERRRGGGWDRAGKWKNQFLLKVNGNVCGPKLIFKNKHVFWLEPKCLRRTCQCRCVWLSVLLEQDDKVFSGCQPSFRLLLVLQGSLAGSLRCPRRRVWAEFSILVCQSFSEAKSMARSAAQLLNWWSYFENPQQARTSIRH